MKTVKSFKKIKINDIMNHPTVSDPIWRSFILLSRILYDNFKKVKIDAQRQREEAKDDKKVKLFSIKLNINLG